MVSTLDAAAMLAPLLQRGNADAAAAIKVASGRAGTWPETNFDFNRMRNLDALVRLRTGRLALADGIVLKDTALTVHAGGDAVEVRDLAGAALGGAATAAIRIERSNDGGAMTGRIKIVKGQLGLFGAVGTGDLTLTLAGRGFGPAGLVSNLSGTGTLQLAGASVREVTPGTLQAAIETALKASADTLSSALRAAIATDAARSTLSLGSPSIALKVQDGVMRLQPLTTATPEGQAVLKAALDLAKFGVSGSWQVETRLPPLPGQIPASAALVSAPPLPPVVQHFNVPLAALDPARGERRTAVETDALERELAVRKVERDLAELERLRRVDEERAAQREKEAKASSPNPGTANNQ